MIDLDILFKVMIILCHKVGLGNIWRFPYQAYRNGGAAFILAYFIILILVGRPMYYMEIALGQYSGSGPVKMWDCASMCRGVGFSIFIVACITGIYYNVIIAYSVFYATTSFQGLRLILSHTLPCIHNKFISRNLFPIAMELLW